MDDTSKRKNLILDLVLGQREFEKFEWLSVLAILKGDMINSELREILSVTVEMKTESSSFALTHSTIKNCGDRNDRDDHMETRLKDYEPAMLILLI